MWCSLVFWKTSGGERCSRSALLIAGFCLQKTLCYMRMYILLTADAYKDGYICGEQVTASDINVLLSQTTISLHLLEIISSLPWDTAS